MQIYKIHGAKFVFLFKMPNVHLLHKHIMDTFLKKVYLLFI